MILRPQINDLRVIGFFLGKIASALGLIMLIPAVIGVLFSEANPAADYVIASEICFIVGLLLTLLCRGQTDLSWMQGMVVVSLGWLMAALLGAVPLHLSGHFASFLDAWFEAMSGFATTGLTLIKDLDHLSLAHNFWRHLMIFIGGQGIVVVAISLFMIKGGAGAFRIYVGEARDERVLPNVLSTARFIWLVSIVYLLLGTLALGVAGIVEGLGAKRAFFDGVCMFMAAFDTGGFTPRSQNILYYHSLLIESITMALMILGALNFNLHYHLWNGKRKELFHNLEMRVLGITMFVIFAIIAIDIMRLNLYPDALTLFRKGVYQLISAHSGTGYSNLYPRQFIAEWGNLSLVGLIVAMGLGGSICSTTGGIKALRVGIMFKGLVQDVKQIMLPESTVLQQKFHHLKEVVLEDKYVRVALVAVVLYFCVYVAGAFLGMVFGYPFLDSLFESTSAAANVGLSCGITRPAMPALLKVAYIIEMWAGRLEFVSILVLGGFLIAVFRGKK
ncbi:MAG: TrkH family potassium uptake protein [Candidatus Omnitrophota bacterium]